VSSPRTTARQVVSFLTVGVIGVGAYLALYLILRGLIDAHLANVLARVLVAIPTTWVNGRRTFGSSVSVRRIVGGSLVILALSTAISAVPLAAEQALLGADNRLAEELTLIVATAVATAARFLLLRNWLFRSVASTADPMNPSAQYHAPPIRPTPHPTGS
jgi:putative flippase GtrA